MNALNKEWKLLNGWKMKTMKPSPMQERGARYGTKHGDDTYKELLKALDDILKDYKPRRRK